MIILACDAGYSRKGVVCCCADKEVQHYEPNKRIMVFQYEDYQRSNDYAKIYSMLQTAEQTARAYFTQCGNSILQPQNPDEATAEILYMYFNRNSCTEEPFQNRVQRILLDRMKLDDKVLGVDPIPDIPLTDFIAPRGIDLTHSGYVIILGLGLIGAGVFVILKKKKVF